MTPDFWQDWLGPSWRSTLLGLVTIATGLVLIIVGRLLKVPELLVAGVPMIPAGILGLVTRDNAASVEAHHESLQGIATAKHEAETAHSRNVARIAAVHEEVQEQVVPLAAQVARNVVREELGEDKKTP